MFLEMLVMRAIFLHAICLEFNWSLAIIVLTLNKAYDHLHLQFIHKNVASEDNHCLLCDLNNLYVVNAIETIQFVHSSPYD